MTFYDAADWRHLPVGEDCCFYADGRFAAPQPQAVAVIKPPRHRFITVTGNARIASIIDGLPDNLITPAGVRGFVRDRRALGQSAIIYTPRSFVKEYQAVLNDFGHGELEAYEKLYWWIATLDGEQWTAESLSANLVSAFDTVVDHSRIWAVQNNQIPSIGPAALADASELFLAWRP